VKGYYVDKASDVVGESAAVVYTPKRSSILNKTRKRVSKRQNDRYPENCVTVKTCVAEALEEEDTDNHMYAAMVLGPARSSEGVKIYYLVRWLDDSLE